MRSRSLQHLVRSGVVLAVLSAAMASPGPKARAQELAVPRQAPIAFRGTVEKLEYTKAMSPDLDAFVRVTFRVTKAARGTHDGDLLTIDQWAGLWRQGQRYRIGQVLDVELYAPSTLALASAVPADAAMPSAPSSGVKPGRVRPQRKPQLRNSPEAQ